MEIAFDSIPIRNLCEDALRAEEDLGPEVAASLRSRLADIRAATSVSDLLLGNPHWVEGTLRVSLAAGYVLIFVANHVSNPMNENGVIWNKVTRVRILSILMQEVA